MTDLSSLPGLSGPSRRTLLGTAGALGAGAALGGVTPAAAADGASGRTATATPFTTAPARAALGRLLPRHADQFRLVPLHGGEERFEVSGRAGDVEVAGTSPAVQLTGVHWYLKYVCGAHLAWNGSQLDLPRRLPAPGRPLERSTSLAHRFALNDTNDGYTAPYADWAFWERRIDLLALHGCNEVLVIAGHDEVYHRVLMDFGYSDAEARAWLPAPSHQPWWLLQNLSSYGGPLTHELLAKRSELGRRIADRLRELGMHPVLPGYYGTVPDGFVARNPGARVVPQGEWHGFKRPDWLDPRTAVFGDVAASFYRHQRDILGAAEHFKMDLLHEGGTAGDVPVGPAAQGVERGLRTAHPDGVWTILGWENNPLPELIAAVDKSKMVIFDGISDRTTAEPDREKDWAGTPYCFGTIPNYGGRTTLGAKTHAWNDRFFRWRDKSNSALAGTAYMPEATDRDPAAFELFSELAWRERPVDRAEWFADYGEFRYGERDRGARAAWAALRDTAYQQHAPERSDPHDSLFAARPDLDANRAAEYAPRDLSYDPARFDAALAGLLDVDDELRGSDAYKADLVDVARQAVAHRSRQLLPQLKTAYVRKDLSAFRALSALWLKLMRLADDIAGAHRAFLLGPWNEAARAMGSSAAESAELERTARVLITVWGDRATSDPGKLHEYGNRDWNGLMADFYLPRWAKWLGELEDALREGRAPRPVDWFAFEEPWTRERKRYPLRPVSDAYRTARRVRDTLAAAPYQGTLSASADPAAVPPGGRATLTGALRNVNGLRPTGRVDFELAGLDAAAQGPTSLPSIAPGGTGTARWRVTAPAGPLDRPLKPLPYELTARYGPRGEERVTAVQPGTLYAAGPLEAGWKTVTNNAAVFGQLGDRFAIEGGGRDLWKGTAEFGAVYREGALTAGRSATVRVDSQANTNPWARTGIIVRNSLASTAPPGSAGFVNLAATPEQGVVLSYDTNGDGTVDTYRRITGLKAPVLLRLTRTASGAYTAQCSTDGGATWRTVATVSVPGAAAVQDVGLFMTAGNEGSGKRGLAEFSGWALA
ncbi:alpha-N-acetylglucosaminidase [Streptomyces sp. NPDC050617]|uniref:alpha-N-acetylglucosaminidase n=1 Tax=Streptomyces sp. NPDC050617 TaxID=3154628 RepID=UPI003424617A